MTALQIIEQLRKRISAALLPLITADYHLLELPYYSNVGDSLIWQGEMEFLLDVQHHCKSMHSLETFSNADISQDDVILFQGGGNFGDIWVSNHNFKMSVVKCYPNNKIIFLPQSVWFRDEENLVHCAEELAKSPNVTICARDKRSYNLLKTYFSNNVILVPDLALYMDISCWFSPCVSCSRSSDILLLRNDVEYKDSEVLSKIRSKPDIIVSDWPSMTERSVRGLTMSVLKSKMAGFPWIVDKFAEKIYRRYVISSGVNFLANANHVYSTRLHGAVLALMMGKRVTVFDNSYGKIGDFFKTWFQECVEIEFVG